MQLKGALLRDKKKSKGKQLRSPRRASVCKGAQPSGRILLSLQRAPRALPPAPTKEKSCKEVPLSESSRLQTLCSLAPCAKLLLENQQQEYIAFLSYRYLLKLSTLQEEARRGEEFQKPCTDATALQCCRLEFNPALTRLGTSGRDPSTNVATNARGKAK